MTVEINKNTLHNIIDSLIVSTPFFLVSIEQQGADSFIVKIDHTDRRITIDDCILLNRQMQEQLSAISTEIDIELTVSSSGIGQPLTDIRQLLKLTGKSIDILLNKGNKMVAVLESIDISGKITFSYEVKQKVEGKKRPILIKETETLHFSDAVWIKEHI